MHRGVSFSGNKQKLSSALHHAILSIESCDRLDKHCQHEIGMSSINLRIVRIGRL